MPTLEDKVYATLAATRIASAMGAVVENWSIDMIEEKHGVFQELAEYEHYHNGWKRPPGTTEDGIERQKLMCAAIIKKGGRINARDLVDTWLEILDADKLKYVSERYDRKLFEVAKTGLVRPTELGNICPHFHVNTTGRSFHAIPLINAGDPEGVLEDVYEIASVYQHPNSLAFPWGLVYNAAMVEALEPDATVDSIINAGLAQASNEIKDHINRALAIADKHGDALAMRRDLNATYDGRTGAYPFSWIDENVAKSFAVLKTCGSDVRTAIVAGINFGRDTDCTAASASGLVAAMAGSSTIPQEWIDQSDEAAKANPYSCSRFTIRETTDGMMGALREKAEKAQRFGARLMERL